MYNIVTLISDFLVIQVLFLPFAMTETPSISLITDSTTAEDVLTTDSTTAEDVFTTDNTTAEDVYSQH